MINDYPQEIIHLTLTVPLTIKQVMYIYNLWYKDIERTKKVIQYYLITGRHIEPGDLEAARIDF
jgi:hypothetical protein